MSASYEFFLTDDAGKRIALMKNYSFASYSRSTRGLGIIQFGLPLKEILSYTPRMFQPDVRIDVWRSPDIGYQKRREGSFFLRKFHIYSREEDNMLMIEFFGRCPLDILRRWSVYSITESNYKKTDNIDDMMKAVVTQEFITDAHTVPVGEFTVDGDLGLGPSATHTFLGKTVRDVCDELKAISFNKNAESSANRRIFFDVVEGPGQTGGFGYVFRTYADLRGTDRTDGTVFSVENGNLKSPEYYEDYLDQITVAQVNTVQVSNADRLASRWNNIMEYRNGTPTDSAASTALGNQMLSDGKKDVALSAFFLSTPGSKMQPRSLYGIDWDLGDLLPVQYAGINMNAEVEIVWVAVNEAGEENIVGANKVGE